ncbi:hypothetical protein L208DRAFT_1378702 [Tricholoma matsutake]|nr:hypothetical protein L208DRAFT_1378702 [Tricholoma matsutake 945]
MIKLQRGQPLPQGMVLKRTQSDCGIHIFIPGEHPTMMWDMLKEGPPGSSWISQEYAMHLRKLGEWRAIIVDGKLLYVVHTICNPSKKLWKWSMVDRYYSLGKISEMHKKGALSTAEHVLNPDSNTFKFCENAKKEFRDFVLETYRGLLAMEVKTIGSRSTLSLFCRMDIGIFMDASRKASYFVNEVERTLTTAVWVKDRDIPINSLALTIRQALHSGLINI